MISKFDAYWSKNMYGYSPGWMCEEVFDDQQKIIDELEAQNKALKFSLAEYDEYIDKIKKVLEI